MKNWRLNNINQSAFEKTGPVPRSITKTFEKFKKELEPNSESEIIRFYTIWAIWKLSKFHEIINYYDINQEKSELVKKEYLRLMK